MSLSVELTNKVYARDGWKCRHCKNRNGLHPHHFVYQSHQGPDLMSNLLTLCASCHTGHHAGHLDIILIEQTKDDLIVRFVRKGKWKPT